MQRGGVRPQERYRAFTRQDLDRIATRFGLDAQRVLEMKAVAAVLPFRTNAYVLEDLIRWHELPDDPIFQGTFPQPGMLLPADLERMMVRVRSGAPQRQIRAVARTIRQRFQPRGVDAWNRPSGEPEGPRLAGIQQASRDAVLFFPRQARACHAYCTYCFYWPRLLGGAEMKRERGDVGTLPNYLAAHREVSQVVLTGGDLLGNTTVGLRRCLEPLLGPEHEPLISIAITSKAPAYWPQRFLQDRDGDDLLRLFEEIQGAGKQLVLVAHYTHPRELETKAAQDAVRRISATGALILGESPVARRVNDESATWAELWRRQVRLGVAPSPMLVEHDTGPQNYLLVPLARACQIEREAHGQMTGLARAARGPVMRTEPGDVRVVGETRIHGERLFVLEFVRARDGRWLGRPFFARWDAKASWFDQLRPAFGDNAFFYEEELRRTRECDLREGRIENERLRR
jgi:L-lysine 2,3-aminomutase